MPLVNTKGGGYDDSPTHSVIAAMLSRYRGDLPLQIDTNPDPSPFVGSGTGKTVDLTALVRANYPDALVLEPNEVWGIAVKAIRQRLGPTGWPEDAVIGVRTADEHEGPAVIVHVNSAQNAYEVRQALTQHGYQVDAVEVEQPDYGVRIHVGYAAAEHHKVMPTQKPSGASPFSRFPSVVLDANPSAQGSLNAMVRAGRSTPSHEHDYRELASGIEECHECGLLRPTQLLDPSVFGEQTPEDAEAVLRLLGIDPTPERIAWATQKVEPQVTLQAPDMLHAATAAPEGEVSPMVEVTHLHCPESGVPEGADNSTHHLVPRSAGRDSQQMTCVYCGKTEKALREAAQKGSGTAGDGR